MTNWQSIVEKHGQLVWQIAYRLTGNEADAADCYQETFACALQVAKTERVRSWPGMLRRIATSRAIDLLRRKTRHSSNLERSVCPASQPTSDPPPPEAAYSTELVAQLRRALAELPTDQAEVFCLRSLDGLSYRQIARQMAISTTAVGTLLHRARAELVRLLKPFGKTDGPAIEKEKTGTANQNLPSKRCSYE